MYIYQVNPDGVNCAVQAHRLGTPVPDGWIQVPIIYENKVLYIISGMLTDRKPQFLIDEEQADMDAEIKIQKHMRKLAIDDLKAKGDLPANFKDKEDK